VAVPVLERRGRRWLVWSFLACPCHLPLTLAILATVLGGTAIGAVLRDHTLVAGLLVTSVWLAGTARGFWLIRRGQRGELACPVPERTP
jgi:mercuric ion transport protein